MWLTVKLLVFKEEIPSVGDDHAQNLTSLRGKGPKSIPKEKHFNELSLKMRIAIALRSEN